MTPLKFPNRRNESLRTALEDVLNVETRDMLPGEFLKIYLNKNHLSHAKELFEKGEHVEAIMKQAMRACLIQNMEPTEKFAITRAKRIFPPSTLHSAITLFYTTRGYMPTNYRWDHNLRIYSKENSKRNIGVITSRDSKSEVYVIVVPRYAQAIKQLGEKSF